MSADEKYDVGINGFERDGYYGVVGTLETPGYDSLHCTHKHPLPGEALECARELRERMYCDWQAREAYIAARPKAPMIVNTADLELYDLPIADHAPSYTRTMAEWDETRLREEVEG